ncbi:MAG: TetR/AcrR family transcriptional regulator [Desulfovibrionaceae bacterium]|nr:TetR/AcrR family transcriptional regulator [Desulfovibrionaceae bacterium]
MNQGVETFERLRDEKKQRVLDAAASEFAEHGFHRASVNRMAAGLSIAKGSIFKYFGTKEGLFEYLFRHSVGLFKGPLRQAAQSSANQDLFERLRLSLATGARFIEEHPLIYRIYLKMLFQEDFPRRETHLSEIRLYSAKYLRPLVDQARARGELRPGLDPAMIVFFLDAVMDRFLQALSVPFMDAGAGLFRADRAEVAKKIGQCVDFLRQGLGR